MITRRNFIRFALAGFATAASGTSALAEDKNYVAKLKAAFQKGKKQAKPGLGSGTRG